MSHLAVWYGLWWDICWYLQRWLHFIHLMLLPQFNDGVSLRWMLEMPSRTGIFKKNVSTIFPLGVSHNQGEACKLKRAIYGLNRHFEIGLKSFLLLLPLLFTHPFIMNMLYLFDAYHQVALLFLYFLITRLLLVKILMGLFS